MADLTFVETSKRKTSVIHQGYIYQKIRENGERSWWRCRDHSCSTPITVTFSKLPTLSIPTLSTLTMWELTEWEVDKVGIDKVGIDEVGIDQMGRQRPRGTMGSPWDSHVPPEAPQSH